MGRVKKCSKEINVRELRVQGLSRWINLLFFCVYEALGVVNLDRILLVSSYFNRIHICVRSTSSTFRVGSLSFGNYIRAPSIEGMGFARVCCGIFKVDKLCFFQHLTRTPTMTLTPLLRVGNSKIDAAFPCYIQDSRYSK